MGKATKKVLMSVRPYAALLHEFAPRSETKQVVDLFKPYERMAGVGGLGGPSGVNPSVRNSTTGTLPEPGYTQCIKKKWFGKLTHLVGLKVDGSAEPMAITHYEPGGFYTVHHDSSDGTAGHFQRLGTFLLYFNEDVKGGNTIFPHMQVAVQPKAGDGIIWYSHLVDGRGDDETLHSGCTVTEGDKWIGTLWIRNISQAGSAAWCRKENKYARAEWMTR